MSAAQEATIDTASPVDAESLFVIREGRPDDHALVLATWLRSYQHRSQDTRSIRTAVYFKGHHTLAERILARSLLKVAVMPEDEEVILGWLLHESDPEEGEVVHYCYVKRSFRRNGICRALLEGLPENAAYSHRTVDAEPVIRLFPNAFYDPYRRG